MKIAQRSTFRRLDEPAWSWTGDLTSFERHLLKREERERRRLDMETILSKPEHMREAITQLEQRLEQLRGWETQPDRFMHENRFFVVERILMQLETVAGYTTLHVWPDFFEVVEGFRQLAIRTAGVRYGAVRSVFESP